jgi:hypothetical protein
VRAQEDAQVVHRIGGLPQRAGEFWIQADAASSPQALNGRSVRMILRVADPDSVFARAVGAAMAMSIK